MSASHRQKAPMVRDAQGSAPSVSAPAGVAHAEMVPAEALPSRDGVGGGGVGGGGAPARRVELILEKLDALPTLSPIAVRLLSVVSSDDARIDEVVTLIESDPALTARILALVRRAEHGLGDRITTVRHATTMLGLEAIQSAVLGVSVYELFERVGHEHDVRLASGGALARVSDAQPLDRAKLWMYLIGVACASESLARHNPGVGVKPSEAFIAGLLHGLGKLALDLALPQSYARVLALAERRRAESSETERAVIGLDHHTAGKRLAERWGLPTALRDVIWLHGHPAPSLPVESPRALLGVVNAARTLCRELHVGLSYDFGRGVSSVGACESSGLDPGVLGVVTAELHDAVSARCGALGIHEQTTDESLLASIAQANRKLGTLNGLLDERARQTDALKRTLAAVSTFNQAVRDPRRTRSIPQTLSLIAQSLASIGPESFVGFVVQTGHDEPWRGWQFDGAGRAIREADLDAPADVDGSPRWLGDLLGGGRDHAAGDVRMLGLLPWVSDCLAGAQSFLRIRAITLCPGIGGEPAAVLLTDLDPASRGLLPAALDALTGSWGVALASSCAITHAARMGEALADSARELASTQAQLTEAQALSRLGEMAAGAAHEMNNPLTVIRARAQILLRRLTTASDREAAQGIAHAASEISDLITSMHLLASPPELRKEPIRVRELVEVATRKAKQRTGLQHEVTIDAAPWLPVASVDTELLTLALAELIGNALQSSTDPKVRIHAHIDPADDRLSLAVEDNGQGMSEHTLRHAFDPFYSDKAAGRRRGMGLARARSIVLAHEGQVLLESRPGEGTRASIVLTRWREQGSMGQAA